MLSLQQQTHCHACCKQVNSMQYYACESCMSNHFPQYHELQPNKRISQRTRDSCVACSKLQACLTVWFSTCLPCQFNSPKSVTEAKLTFLQQLDPSPLSKDFKGDVSLIVKGSDESVQAHRFILASKSHVFKKMMEIDMIEKHSGIIQIEGLSTRVVRSVVNFLYTGEIQFSDQVSPQDVLIFAHQYEIRLLKDQCENDLMSKVAPNNLLEMLSTSYRFGAEKLKQKAINLFTNHPDLHKTVLDDIFTN